MPDDRQEPDDRPSRYVEEGVTIYRASALGSCPKVLVAIGMGMTPEPPPAWLLPKFDQGIAGEPVVKRMLEGMGWKVYADQHLVQLRIGSRFMVRGHLDCLMTKGHVGEHGERVGEIKCVSRAYRDEIVKVLPPLYHWQCAVYGRVLGLPVTLVLGVKDEAGNVEHVELIDVDVAGPVAVKMRVYSIERHIADGTWPACSYRQFPCPFPELCDDPVPEATEDWELEERLAESLVGIRHVRQ